MAKLPSTDPRVFGPPIWATLHILSLNYPVQPTVYEQRRWLRFMLDLAALLPCQHCGNHFRSMLRQSHGPLRSRDALVSFLLDCHNQVTARTRPEARSFTLRDLQALYIQQHPRLPLARVA